MIPIYTAWAVIFAVVVVYLVVGIPLRLHQLTVACTGIHTTTTETCTRYQLTVEGAQVLREWGISLGSYAWTITALSLVAAPVYLLLALVILIRSRGQIAMLCSAFGLLLFVPGYFVSISEAITQKSSSWLGPLGLLQLMAFWAAVAFGFTFPSGRFFPRWTRALLIVATATALVKAFFPTSSLVAAPGPGLAYWFPFAIVGLLASALLAQIARYRQRSTTVEQLQTKWVVFGFSLMVLEIGGFGLAPVLLPGVRDPGRTEVFFTIAAVLASTSVAVVLGTSFAVAILRYRLFAIDVLINRTLVYGALSVGLAAVYGGVTLLGEFLLRPFTPGSHLTVALSTLAVAALFQPARQWVQTYVDRRFFRRKFNAERTIEAFRALARDEVDLDRLSDALTDVARETMQPSQVSLWLREP
jgi:hypothetical protein